MKNYDTEEYKGCKICIHHEQGPENPFEAWDCEPPLLTCYDGRPKAYNDAPESWYEVLHLLPDSCFQRGKRVEFIRSFLNCSIREFAELRRDYGDDAYAEMLNSELEEKPSGWKCAQEWMETAASILNWGGITAVYDQSNGYCQGDSTLCLAIATPAWMELVGAPPETHKAQMESAIELYGWWAWGDVYGFTCEDENGEDLEDFGASVWGFYGPDHEKSGLMEAAREAIDYHLEKQAEQAANLEAAFTF